MDEDMFPRPPGAPDDPTFWGLSELILKYDGRMQETPEHVRDEVFEQAVAESGVNAETVAYMAYQRAIRALNYSDAMTIRLNRDKVAKLAAMWMEAFLIGTQYERTHNAPTA
jgi:hypothetical protein